jgi:hypothetical protein
MPYTTYGLLKGIRSHTIDSPSVQTTLATGRPNACNLCHLDKSIEWTNRQLTEHWHASPANLDLEEKSMPWSLRALLSGDAGQRVIMAWSMGWAAAKRASGEDWLAPYLAILLQDPYSAVRHVAHESLRKIAGYQSFEYDYVAPDPNARARALAIWRQRHPSPERYPALNANGSELPEAMIQALIKKRPTKNLFLAE